METASIYSALKTKLLLVAGFTSSNTAWENSPFTPTAGQSWQKVSLLPAEPFAAGVGSNASNRETGIFQVDIFKPVTTGDAPARTLAKAVTDAFKRGTDLTYSTTTITIVKSWTEAGRIDPDEPAWYHLPVFISWRADTAN